MHLELAQAMKDAVTVRANANELVVASGKPVPYPFTVGVIRRLKNGSYRATVWTPAASKPRGYAAAARAALEDVIRELETGARRWPVASVYLTFREPKGLRDFQRQAYAKPEWFGRPTGDGRGGWELPAPEHRHHYEHLLAATEGKAHSAQAEDYTGPELPESQPKRGDLNPEGLTFPEWMGAAGIPMPAPIGTNREIIRELARAWQAGEDPTEHRAAVPAARAHYMVSAAGQSEGFDNYGDAQRGAIHAVRQGANEATIYNRGYPMERYAPGATGIRVVELEHPGRAPVGPPPTTDPAVKSARAYNLGFRGEPLPPELAPFARIYELGKEDGRT